MYDQSIAEREEVGRAARGRASRSSLGEWDTARRGHDALQTVLGQNELRSTDLLPIRHGRMSASPWTYYRGAAAVMAADLASRPHTGLMVQLCGDAHVLNFGLWATPERQLSFDLRDFDETLPGPFEWDLMRMLSSLQVLACSQGQDRATHGRDAVRSALRGYRTQMAHYADTPFLDIWYEQFIAEDLIALADVEDQDRLTRRVEKRATKRSTMGALRKFTEIVEGQIRLTEAPPFRVRAGVCEATAAAAFEDYLHTLPEERRYLMDRYRMVDVVRQVVGVGSVGMRVHLVLLEGSRPDDLLLIQTKKAGPSVYEPFLEPSRYPNHGQRVTVGRRYIQSSTDILVGWTRSQGRDYYVRQFRDMKVIPSGETVAPWLSQFALKCGRVLARAHAATGDAVAINAYIGKGRAFDRALCRFADLYAGQNETDHAQLVEAISDGTVDSAPGW